MIIKRLLRSSTKKTFVFFFHINKRLLRSYAVHICIYGFCNKNAVETSPSNIVETLFFSHPLFCTRSMLTAHSVVIHEYECYTAVAVLDRRPTDRRSTDLRPIARRPMNRPTPNPRESTQGSEKLYFLNC